MAYINGKEILFPIIKAADGSVLYSEKQELTDEQKQMARENINAVDASLVVSRVSGNNHIPNGEALLDFFVSPKDFSPEQQRTARKNIGAVSQSEVDEAVANIGNAPNKEWKVIATGEITEDGVSKITIAKDNNGNSFEIYDALVVHTEVPIAIATANIYFLVNNEYSNLAFQALHKSDKRFSRITANWDGGNWTGISLVAGNSCSYAEAGGMPRYLAKKSPATSISLSTENANTPFPIGTKFELRGVVKV